MGECGNKKSINKPLDIFKFQNGVTVIKKFSLIINPSIAILFLHTYVAIGGG